MPFPAQAFRLLFLQDGFDPVLVVQYQRMVSRMPSSNLCAGVQPSSRWILEASMA